MEGGGVNGKRCWVVGLEGVMGAARGGGETDLGVGCWKTGGRTGGVETRFISGGSDLTMTEGAPKADETGGVGGRKFSLNWKSAGVNLYCDGLKLDSVVGVVDLEAAGGIWRVMGRLVVLVTAMGVSCTCCWLTGILACVETCVRGASSSRARPAMGRDSGTVGGGDVDVDDADIGVVLKWIP